MMRPEEVSRRLFLGGLASGMLGRTALASLPGLPHHKPAVKRVIVLFQSGGPSQLESFDPKPGIAKLYKQELPESVRMGQRLTTMSASQSSFPLVPSKYSFRQYGQSGAWVSELFPHIARIADDLCFIKSMHTEQINHDPAVTFFQTGFQIAGRPSIGSWVNYGLGSENQDLPGFVVMISPGQGTGGQPLYDRLWGSGFLPSKYQGVKFRSVGDPVLFLKDPDGFSRTDRRAWLDALTALNQLTFDRSADPETAARIAQYELAFRMQASIPELTDLSKEPASTFTLYGQDARKPGTFAANCLLARRLAERGVRFIQLFHRDWDHHGGLPKGMPARARETDQASAALVTDLKQRGLLDDTLVLWAGEFGRTVYCQGRLTDTDYGRDHHPRCFTIWLAGGGVRSGFSLGATDDFSYNITEDPVSIHDLQATILHLLGVDHKRLTFKFQGRHFRLTDVHGELVARILSGTS